MGGRPSGVINITIVGLLIFIVSALIVSVFIGVVGAAVVGFVYLISRALCIVSVHGSATNSGYHILLLVQRWLDFFGAAIGHGLQEMERCAALSLLQYRLR